MKLYRYIALWLWLLIGPAFASQATLVTPGAPLTMSGLASFLNSALLSVGSCNSGNSAPANGTGSTAFAGECWINTSANPWIFSYTSDGTHWSEFGQLNTSTFVWTSFSNGSQLGGQAGFQNVLRNSSLTAWFHGCVSAACTVTTSIATSNWCTEGVLVVPIGASVTCQQVTSSLPTGSLTLNGVKVTGAASVTDLKLRFVIDSQTASRLAGQTVTFQFLWANNSGSSITPTLATNYPTTLDGGVTGGAPWGGTTADLAATNLQACTNSSSCAEAYTLSVSANAVKGYEFVVDFGNNFGSASNTLTLAGGFDARVTPGAATGLNASPPAPEVRDAQSDLDWNRRFYTASYENGTAPGTSTANGAISGSACASTNCTGSATANLPVAMRAAPTIAYWDTAGAASKVSTIPSASTTITAGATAAEAPFNISTRGFYWQGPTGTASATSLMHYTADASIWGG